MSVITDSKLSVLVTKKKKKYGINVEIKHNIFDSVYVFIVTVMMIIMNIIYQFVENQKRLYYILCLKSNNFEHNLVNGVQSYQ